MCFFSLVYSFPSFVLSKGHFLIFTSTNFWRNTEFTWFFYLIWDYEFFEANHTFGTISSTHFRFLFFYKSLSVQSTYKVHTIILRLSTQFYPLSFNPSLPMFSDLGLLLFKILYLYSYLSQSASLYSYLSQCSRPQEISHHTPPYTNILQYPHSYTYTEYVPQEKPFAELKGTSEKDGIRSDPMEKKVKQTIHRR